MSRDIQVETQTLLLHDAPQMLSQTIALHYAVG